MPMCSFRVTPLVGEKPWNCVSIARQHRDALRTCSGSPASPSSSSCCCSGVHWFGSVSFELDEVPPPNADADADAAEADDDAQLGSCAPPLLPPSPPLAAFGRAGRPSGTRHITCRVRPKECER